MTDLVYLLIIFLLMNFGESLDFDTHDQLL